MALKVFLSPEALSDLEGIVAYIAVHTPPAAGRMGLLLLDAAHSLGSLPRRGRTVPEFRRRELREIIVRSYRVIYRVSPSDQSIEVIRFWHAARGFPQIPRFRSNR
jgi:toxin ParE1/3/4